MSIHVSPPFGNFAPPAAAGEIISSHVIGDAAVSPFSPSWDDLRGTAHEVQPDVGDMLSVRLGHLGVVIAIALAGTVAPRTLELAAPAREATDQEAIHLRVARQSLYRCRNLFAGGMPEQAFRSEQPAKDDPVLQRLSLALDAAERSEEAFGGVYADALRLAIVTRILSDHALPGEEPVRYEEPAARPSRTKSGLPKWRLKRVIAYIEENLGEAITLGDMAHAAGLSRMHFAAQFRIAHGMRPHEYLLRRRIERAQQMLMEGRESLVEIALTVGFQTQAHFTTVFRRFVGDTPYQWRCINRAAA